MTSRSCFALFCEDIRREPGSKETLIGVMPALQRVPKFPGAFQRLSIYYRVRLPLDQDVNERVLVDLEIDEGVSVDIELEDSTPYPKENLERALALAKERNAPYAEVQARLIVDGIPITGAGQIRAIAKIGDERLVGGYLNIKLKDDSSASPPPSSQSPSGA
jgi:hypothetical protein